MLHAVALETDGTEEAAEAVENLLESYFMQIDSTYDRLISIGECACSKSCQTLHMLSTVMQKESTFWTVC